MLTPDQKETITPEGQLEQVKLTMLDWLTNTFKKSGDYGLITVYHTSLRSISCVLSACVEIKDHLEEEGSLKNLKVKIWFYEGLKNVNIGDTVVGALIDPGAIEALEAGKGIEWPSKFPGLNIRKEEYKEDNWAEYFLVDGTNKEQG